MIIFYSIPEALERNGCKWEWKNVSLKDTNNLTIEDLEEENLKIVPYVMDLPAFKFYQHQVNLL
jgi:hypothetical protein